MIRQREKSKPMNNFTNKVYIASKDQAEYASLINNAQLEDLVITQDKSLANIVLADPPLIVNDLPNLPKLEWLQSTFAGVDALVVSGLRQDYELTNVKGIFGQQISEYVVGNTIEYFRHFSTYRQQQLKSQWQPHPYQSLADKSILVLGTGDIGCHVAKVCNALGMKTGGVNRTGIPAKASPFKYTFHIGEFKSAVKDADIIVSTLPSTPDTRGYLNAARLAHADNALLFSVGRGDVLVEDDLIPAIENGNIAHAFLDVFEQEPLPKSSPFWSHDKVSVTPHIAAVSFPHQVFEQFKENYLRWYDGFKLQNRVDFKKGY